jgi:hypothetical protein
MVKGMNSYSIKSCKCGLISASFFASFAISALKECFVDEIEALLAQPFIECLILRTLLVKNRILKNMNQKLQLIDVENVIKF